MEAYRSGAAAGYPEKCEVLGMILSLLREVLVRAYSQIMVKLSLRPKKLFN